jgi:hypothetical protein
MKVFSFSLFGDNPIYTIGTIKNVNLINQNFADWNTFIYTNKNKEDDIIKKLIDLGCIIKYENDQRWYNSTWRFKAISDDSVDIMLCRDSDSRVFIRDVVAIEEWLESDYNYHIIRDHPVGHHWKMNAGMWGAKKTDFISNINMLLEDYKTKNPNLLNHKNFDQFFLRDVVYPKIVNDSLIHDEYYGYEKNNYKIKRDRKIDNFAFIGESIDENDKSRFINYEGEQRESIIKLYYK